MPVDYRSWRSTRTLLLAGFGGLLIIMALAGLDAVRLIQSIENRGSAIRADFLERNRLLNRLRSDLYLSGTWVRDYMLEPDPVRAETDRSNLLGTRAAMEKALTDYEHIAGASIEEPIRDLRRELDDYWRVLDPVMQWSPAARQTAGYTFLRDQVYPRRTAMVALADRIGALSEHQLDSGILDIAALFSGFRIRVVFTTAIALCLGGLLAAFATQRILTYESAVAAYLREIEQARAELKELSNRILEIQESERKALARELHDEVGQSLSAVLIGISNLNAQLPPEASAAVTVPLADLRAIAEGSLRAVRNMTLLLRPSMLDDLGLLPALQWQGREVSKRSGIAVTVDAAGVAEDLPEAWRTTIYRVVQEAVHNVEKHARATAIRVTLRVSADVLALSVQDNGRGFDTARERGMGLLGMNERIATLGGSFSIESEPGKGTLVMVKLPLSA
jgi:signal transduction histidine kinase